jgi:polyisoprenoid-binding protein YceI
MKKVIPILLLLLTLIPMSAIGQSTTNWTLDPAHTNIEFTVTHMGFFEVTGAFNQFEGQMTSEGENFETAKAKTTIQVASIDTDNGDRDAHLKSGDFFAAAEHPELTFVSKEMKKVGKKTYKMASDITIRGTTKPITLDVIYKGRITDMFGNDRIGFTATGTLNRKDFGLNWNKMTEGVAVVSDEVQLTIKAQLINQTKPSAQTEAEK